ncbi:MAG: DegT/DnrJ/EryC1/StrS family aminotransferase [Polyangiales bacterium]
MSIPLVDLKAQYARIRHEIEPIVLERLAACDYVGGAAVRAFEGAFAKYCGASHSVGCANGTDGIELLVRACGYLPGDEVIIPANTFVATAVGLMRAGVKPVVVDCEEVGFGIDPSAIEAAITRKTKAIMPVWLFGAVHRFDEIAAVAKKHGLALLEDASQAHGASWKGARVGSLGTAAAFSLYPGKNLGAYGDAGVIVTSDDRIAQACRDVRNYGSEVKYQHPIFGYNSRLDTVQAAILEVKLRHLDTWIIERRAAAKAYDARFAALAEKGVLTASALKRPALLGEQHVFHLYVVRVRKRDAVLERLHKAGIGAGIHYPVAVHLHGATKSLGYTQGAFPMAETLSHEILSLPLYAEITEPQIDKVVDAVAEAVKEVA